MTTRFEQMMKMATEFDGKVTVTAKLAKLYKISKKELLANGMKEITILNCDPKTGKEKKEIVYTY